MKVFCILSTDFKGHLNISEITQKVKRQKSQAQFIFTTLYLTNLFPVHPFSNR